MIYSKLKYSFMDAVVGSHCCVDMGLSSVYRYMES